MIRITSIPFKTFPETLSTIMVENTYLGFGLDFVCCHEEAVPVAQPSLPVDIEGGNMPPLRCREPSKSRTLARDHVKKGVQLWRGTREKGKKSLLPICANQLVPTKVNSEGLPRKS